MSFTLPKEVGAQKAHLVGDFSGWDTDGAKYDKAFDKLLKELQAESEKV